LIDCDVHAELPNVQALFPYLPLYWVEQIQNTSFKGAEDTYYPRNSPIFRDAGRAAQDGLLGASIEELRRQVLDPAKLEYAILNCTYAVDSLHNPDQAVALAQAINDWQINEWLNKEPRVRASVVVPSQIPALAAREIDRVGDHPGFVQVLLPVRSQHPYGSRLYTPLWEAIARHDVVAGLHFGGAPGNPPTPSGWPSYYLEEYVAMAQVFASQVTSLIVEGVFELFPRLRVALIESGFTWLPTHMWRLDKEWRNLRRQTPWVKRAPSDYIRAHIRVTAQPLDAPVRPSQLLEILDHFGSDDMVMYASDYPHRHAADLECDLLRHLPAGLREKVQSENARTFYNFAKESRERADTPKSLSQTLTEGAE